MKWWKRLKPLAPREVRIPVEVGRWWRRNRVWKRITGRYEGEQVLSSEQIELEEPEDDMGVLSGLRTSTKAGAAGLGSLGAVALMTLPFAEEAEAFIQQACQSENGAVPFLVGGAIVWVTTYITARRSKTPTKPGKL